MKQKAINKLISQGMTESEAINEFNDKVNYYLRIRIMNTKEDYNYAVDCAIDNILYDDIKAYDENILELIENMLYN